MAMNFILKSIRVFVKKMRSQFWRPPLLISEKLLSEVKNYYLIADITIRDTLQGKYKAQLPGRCGYDLWRLP